MQKVRTTEAVGMVLSHDITAIIPGVFKGAAFKKGHVVTANDVDELLNLGKEHLFVKEDQPGIVHENTGALRLARAMARTGITITEPSQGKVNLMAENEGLLKVNAEILRSLNSLGLIAAATLHRNLPVSPGQVVAGVRVVPLTIPESIIQEAETLCAEAGGIVEVKKFRTYKAGIITTGNEIYYGRIPDSFGPVLREKLAAYKCSVLGQKLVPDSEQAIRAAAEELLKEGAELLVFTGGMSVDPDDLTPGAIRNLGAREAAYGVPVLPGSMFLLAYLGDIPVLGLPGCVMYCRTTVFDLIFPRVLAGEKISGEDLIDLGHGGLCMECEICRYPACPFGKG